MEEKKVELKNVGGPNFYAPRYAEYIWKEHAPNFIKYVTEMDTGDSAKICKMTDAAIADIWAILEDDEKTLDILAKYSNLSISLRPKFMESLSTVNQINVGLHYIVQALSYVHARMCFIHIESGEFHVAETYIMQFENMSWWKKVIEQNKKFGGQELLEENLVYKVTDSTFNWLKSLVLEERNMFSNAIRMLKPGVEMMAWKFNSWDNSGKKCPEPYLLTEEEKQQRVEQLSEKKEQFIMRPYDKESHPILYEYRERLQKDKAMGNLESIESMMTSGIFWTTIKCPKCVREESKIRYFFYNPCKLCRQIQATALLGHMPCDEKFFSWIFKQESSITEDDFQRIKDEEREKKRQLRSQLDQSAGQAETDKRHKFKDIALDNFS